VAFGTQSDPSIPSTVDDYGTDFESSRKSCVERIASA
jgi:hypothetical protein